MLSLQRPAALAAAAAAIAALTACSPAPQPSPQPEVSELTPTPEATVTEVGLWEGMTAHCGTVEPLMQVDPSVDPQVNGYAPADLRDSGPREAASGEVETLSDGSPRIYVVAEGDQAVPIARRLCAPSSDYLAWLNDADDVNGLTLQPGDRLWLVPNEPA
ncbi:hypothetical protein [Agrococcus sp. KRD186]|uniref:hypothetical protein n=1 Tax=Agrococcus sp. KRD186 TaxID=2729730 RepID=UPI0019CF767A|nr:hypothetical protein [Agrococcus sp. KRD186]